jgi:glucose/arabinose dehydrogenase
MKRLNSLLIILTVLFGTAGCYLWGSGTGVADETAGPVVATPVQNSTATLLPAPTPSTEEASTTALPTTVSSDEIVIALKEVTSNLQNPTDMTHAGNDSGWLFIAEKIGRVRIVRDGQLLDAPYLDITDRVGSSGSEQGLLGITFHPDYDNNGFMYVDYTDRNGDTVISRFTVTGDPEIADADSELVLITQDQPAANHNGGQVAFGPDGYLYIAFGDGGGAGDSFGNGQNGQSILAKILRIDVDNGTPYSIPSDNPFANDSQFRGETWAYGLRNPWRFSFDRLTGELIIADVGQGTYEEVNTAPPGQGGQNYGWPIMEGLHCYSGTCDPSAFTLPVIEYDHSQGCSITGGYVYRGAQFPVLNGVYFFGDYCSGIMWGLSRTNGGEWDVAKLLETGIQLSSFGQDEAGELYVMDLGGGTLYQIVVPGS